MRSIPVESLGEILDLSGQIDILISECQPYTPDENVVDEFIEDLEGTIHELADRFKIMKKVVVEWRRIKAEDAKRRWTPKAKKAEVKKS